MGMRPLQDAGHVLLLCIDGTGHERGIGAQGKEHRR
jgi:hypothetical protein